MDARQAAHCAQLKEKVNNPAVDVLWFCLHARRIAYFGIYRIFPDICSLNSKKKPPDEPCRRGLRFASGLLPMAMGSTSDWTKFLVHHLYMLAKVLERLKHDCDRSSLVDQGQSLHTWPRGARIGVAS